MDKSPTKTTVSSNTNRIWKITTGLFLSTTVIFVSLFIWSEYKGDTNSGNQVTPCSRSPCEHGGNCSVTDNSFSCTCLNGFTGLQCKSTPCDNYSCDNGGTCFLDEFQPKCACKNGFTGENCTLTPCSRSPCEHGGNCSVADNSFSCTCLNGFTGLLCQSTPCDNYSCDNGGTCFLDEFQPKCACKNGFTGENCTLTPCSRSPCEHGGNCLVTDDSFSCTCLNGFTGLLCQIYHANFENKMDSMFTQDLTVDFDWIIKKGPTLTSLTGPSSAYEGDYYLYIETLQGSDGDVARLLSHDFIFVFKTIGENWKKIGKIIIKGQ